MNRSEAPRISLGIRGISLTHTHTQDTHYNVLIGFLIPILPLIPQETLEDFEELLATISIENKHVCVRLYHPSWEKGGIYRKRRFKMVKVYSKRSYVRSLNRYSCQYYSHFTTFSTGFACLKMIQYGSVDALHSDPENN